MIPVKQLYRHDPPKTWGDCHRAAIASILELPCDDVPHFGAPPLRDDWRVYERSFLLNRGIIPLTIGFEGGKGDYHSFLSAMAILNPDTYWLLGGTSKNGVGHTVVVLNDKIAHDPALDNSGIVGPMEDGYFWGTFFGSSITLAKPVEHPS